MTTVIPTSFTLGRASLVAGAFFFWSAHSLWPALADAYGASRNVQTFAGAARVIDGDTIEINGQRVRLEGIDAPETAQTCMSSTGASWPCGRVATKALISLVAGQDIACDSRGNDKYGRILGVCYADGRDINATMVRNGFAWAFIKYSSSYVAEEKKASAEHIGIWQGPAEPAWEFRHKGWQIAEVAAPKGCAIKGNVSSKGHIYHMPWSPWYDRVTVDERRGERWFCSEAEAQSAGWRPAMTN